MARGILLIAGQRAGALVKEHGGDGYIWSLESITVITVIVGRESREVGYVRARITAGIGCRLSVCGLVESRRTRHISPHDSRIVHVDEGNLGMGSHGHIGESRLRGRERGDE